MAARWPHKPEIGGSIPSHAIGSVLLFMARGVWGSVVVVLVGLALIAVVLGNLLPSVMPGPVNTCGTVGTCVKASCGGCGAFDLACEYNRQVCLGNAEAGYLACLAALPIAQVQNQACQFAWSATYSSWQLQITLYNVVLFIVGAMLVFTGARGFTR